MCNQNFDNPNGGGTLYLNLFYVFLIFIDAIFDTLN